jgi:hypothetical protein
MPLMRCGRSQQGQRLIGMGGQHHRIKALAARGGDHIDAAFITRNTKYGRVEAFVVDARCDFFDVVFGPTPNGVPLRAVVDLDQAVVMAKPHHGSHWKLQHLIGGATPDAPEHGQ